MSLLTRETSHVKQGAEQSRMALNSARRDVASKLIFLYPCWWQVWRNIVKGKRYACISLNSIHVKSVQICEMTAAAAAAAADQNSLARLLKKYWTHYFHFWQVH